MTLKQKIFLATIIAVVLLNAIAFIFLRGVFKETKETAPRQVPKATVAIVIDDWGYNLDCIKLLRQIDQPITVSVLPNLAYSVKTAQVARTLGQEVVLHLPLEPDLEGREYIGLEKDTITANMDEQTVRSILNKALANVAGASGVSNHMGSQATRDKRLMTIIFNELKKRKLFFLDNRVIGDSVCSALAKATALECAVRDIFLDNKNEREYIRGQLRQLQVEALASGAAIGVGHARPMTLEVLKEEIPKMQAQGIKFVPVSALVE
ncbi:MAG: divergent polysaccharide deacetylase family protein [Candidatus Omnitrophota bacterium]